MGFSTILYDSVMRICSFTDILSLSFCSTTSMMRVIRVSIEAKMAQKFRTLRFAPMFLGQFPRLDGYELENSQQQGHHAFCLPQIQGCSGFSGKHLIVTTQSAETENGGGLFIIQEVKNFGFLTLYSERIFIEIALHKRFLARF